MEMVDAYWYRERWSATAPLVLSPTDHSFWLASTVFDGARRFRSRLPDLRPHCARLLRSAMAIGMKPAITSKGVERLCIEGLKRLDHGEDVYIRPALHFKGSRDIIGFDPTSIELTVSLVRSETPFMKPFSACFVPFRRPAPDMAVTDAKSASLYPSSLRALAHAKSAGFENAILCDQHDHVAEFASANLFIVSDGMVCTPELSGSFLNGITRCRVIDLLRDANIPVFETKLSKENVLSADEIFLTGNFSQIQPCTRIGGKRLGANPITSKIGDLYARWVQSLPELIPIPDERSVPAEGEMTP